MGLRKDIGIDSQGEPRDFTQNLGASGEKLEFSLGLNIEEENVSVKSGVDLPKLFAHSRENNFLESGSVRLAHALKFATGDDVKARSLLC